MMKDRTIVKAGEEKNMAVQSPRGILQNMLETEARGYSIIKFMMYV